MKPSVGQLLFEHQPGVHLHLEVALLMLEIANDMYSLHLGFKFNYKPMQIHLKVQKFATPRTSDFQRIWKFLKTGPPTKPFRARK